MRPGFAILGAISSYPLALPSQTGISNLPQGRIMALAGADILDSCSPPSTLMHPSLIARPLHHSVMTWSAHSTSSTKIFGLPHFAPQLVKSASVTPRAREQAPPRRRCRGRRSLDNESRSELLPENWSRRNESQLG